MKKLLVLLLLFAASAPMSAQPQPGPYFIATFFKVPPGKGQAYLKMERDIWKPIHEYRKKQGEIINWAVYAVEFSGEGSEYNYVAIEYYESASKFDQGNFDQWIKAVHPKRTADDIIKATTDARVQVKTEMGRLVKGTQAATQNEKPAPMYALAFFKTSQENAEVYSNLVTGIFQPVEQELVNEGKIKGSSLWEVWFPSGKSAHYNFVRSSAEKNWMEMEQDIHYDEAWKKVHPNLGQAAIRKVITPLREIYKTEIWWLSESIQ
ncbi:MAG: hypothetical protein JST46_10285 [Bacteroidetes bacterium]|nr:hypothetical protein [Bacteroidota bacterium]